MDEDELENDVVTVPDDRDGNVSEIDDQIAWGGS